MPPPSLSLSLFLSLSPSLSLSLPPSLLDLQNFVYRTARNQNAFSAVFSTEGRVVGLCWAELESKEPKGFLTKLQPSRTRVVSRYTSEAMWIHQKAPPCETCEERGWHRLSCAQHCTWGPDVTRKEAWPFYRTIFGVCLYWEFEEPQGPKGLPQTNVSKARALGSTAPCHSPQPSSPLRAPFLKSMWP